MIVISLMLLVLAVVLFVWGVSSDWGGERRLFTGLVVGIVALIMLAFTIRWQFGDSTLTGYLYQRSDAYGYATYDLRFSQNAGMDNQPSFCVQSGSREDLKLRELVGKDDKKVEIFIPAKGFHMVNNYFECASFAQLKDVETVTN